MGETIDRGRLERALPDTSGTISVSGLDQPVEIVRDSLGIPHVRAASLRDSFFGQGFAHAQDRLWQMVFDRARAAGSAAALAGRTLLDSDILMRRLDLVASARADYDAFDDDTRMMLDAYAAGVNAFIDTTTTLPVELDLLGVTPDPWHPWDAGAIFKVRHVLMGTWGSKLWRARVLAALGPEAVPSLGMRGGEAGVVIVPPGTEYHEAIGDLAPLMPGIEALSRLPEAAGSNNWAVSGSRTASGKPLVGGDPHRFLDVPNVYYQNHLTCPEADVIGYSFAGIPGFPHFGHNAHVAWCITHAAADYQDLYVERFRDDGGSLQYAVGDTWRPAEARRETIEVRGDEPVEIDVVVTRHGPVVVGDARSGYAIALRYSALDRPNPGFRCLVPQMRATSVADLDEAMRDWVDPCNSLTMADVHGAIGYLHRGRVPLRHAANGWLPVPGWNDEHEWQGDIPFEELPRSRDPEPGWIATANNRVVGDDYPYYLSLDYAPPYRAMRVIARLEALDGATIDDIEAMHADRQSIPSRWLVDALAGLALDDPLAQAARERLAAWDGVMDKELVEPAIYAVTREHLTRHVLQRPAAAALAPNPYPGEPAAMGPAARLWSQIPRMLRDGDTSLLADGETWDAPLAAAFAEAVAFLSAELGDDLDQWRWERLHRTRPVHPLSALLPDAAEALNPPSVTLGGDADTLQAAGTFPGQSYFINGTSVARYAFDLGSWDMSRWVSPLGASGHPGSPHYADQAESWSAVRMRPMRYSREAVDADAASTQRLEPA